MITPPRDTSHARDDGMVYNRIPSLDMIPVLGAVGLKRKPSADIRKPLLLTELSLVYGTF